MNLYGSSYGKSRDEVQAMVDSLLADLDAGRVGTFIVLAEVNGDTKSRPDTPVTPNTNTESQQQDQQQPPLETAKEREARKLSLIHI